MLDPTEKLISLVAQNKEVISGLVGVVIGGLLTYLASKRLERVKAKELSERLHCLLFIEIYGHTIELSRDIDFVLPEWLHRGEPEIWKPNELLSKLKIYYLNTFCFDNFIEQLTYSPLLVPITNYYQVVKQLNEQIKHSYDESGKGEVDVESMIRRCNQILEASIHAIEDLLNTKGIKKFFTPLIENRIADYKAYKQINLYRITIAKHDYWNLKKWEPDLQRGKIPADLPEQFRSDKGALLLNYLEQARRP